MPNLAAIHFRGEKKRCRGPFQSLALPLERKRCRGPFRFLALSLLVVITVILAAPPARAGDADDNDDPSPPPATAPTEISSLANDDVNRNIVLPTEVGDHKLKFRTHIGSKLVELSYLLHLPPDYGVPGKKHPMLVFFHGVGECGTDLAGVYALGPMTLLKADGGNPTFAATCPFIVLCPQCPPRGQTWNTDYIYKAVAQLVDQTINKTRTDPDRVYATGLSMGGLGSWCVAEEAPDLFAAIAPLSAMAWHPENVLKQLKYVSVWCVVGMDDQPRFLDGTRSMDAALSKGPIKQRFMYLIGNGHDAWYPPYQNAQFYEWLLAHRRPNSSERERISQQSPPTTQPLPTAPGHYLLSFDTKLGDQPYSLDYVLYIPKGYQSNASAAPGLLFLHEQNTIGPDFNGLCVHGPDLALERNPALKENFPFVVISPRLPVKCDWETPGMTQTLLSLIDHVSQRINIDPNRISLSGIDGGATGVWKLASEAPGRFSAIAPVVTTGQLTPGDDRAQVVKDLPGRVFVKGSDAASINRIGQLMRKSKLDWHLARLGDDVSALGDHSIYSDYVFLRWLSQQHRKS
jgi:predicted peptidase